MIKYLMKTLCILLACFSVSFVFAQAKVKTKPSLLFVIAAQSAKVTRCHAAYRLTMEHPHINYFTDRPYRQVGSVSVVDFVSNWTKGVHSFKKDHPNAAFVAGLDLQGSRKEVRRFVELSKPQFNDKTKQLSFALTGLSEKLTIKQGRYANTVLFVDNMSGCYFGHASGVGCL